MWRTSRIFANEKKAESPISTTVYFLPSCSTSSSMVTYEAVVPVNVSRRPGVCTNLTVPSSSLTTLKVQDSSLPSPSMTPTASQRSPLAALTFAIAIAMRTNKRVILFIFSFFFVVLHSGVFLLSDYNLPRAYHIDSALRVLHLAALQVVDLLLRRNRITPDCADSRRLAGGNNLDGIVVL